MFIWLNQGIRVPSSSKPYTGQPRVESIPRMVPIGKVEDQKQTPTRSVPKRPIPDAILKSYQRAQETPLPRQPALHAHQIMTSPVLSLDPDTSVAQAWAFICQRRFRHVPILSRTQQLMGILSDRDILREAAGLGTLPLPTEQTPDASRRVSDIMTPRVLTASPDTEIRQIARVLFEAHIGTMPILDVREHLVGLITRSDILRVFIKQAPLDLWI